MTNFERENFSYHGGYLTYLIDGEYKFVARFKYKPGGRGTFTTFLIKNFTVEEYFARLKDDAPLTILQSKGYMQPHTKKMLKERGYPVTQDGLAQMLRDEIRKYSDKRVAE